MKRGWVRFNRLMLRLSMAGGFIISIILAYLSYVLISKNNDSLGFLPFVVFLAGVVVVLGIHSIWGLIVDAAENIALMPKEVAKELGKSPSRSGQAFEEFSKEIRIAQSENEQADDEYIAHTEVINQRCWVCTSCGNANSQDCTFCQECGMKKNADLPKENEQAADKAASAAEAKKQGEWRCTSCGNVNLSDWKFCQKCGMKNNTDLPS